MNPIITAFESPPDRGAGLLPDNAYARARAINWMFAALNTVEPPIVDRSVRL